jgi:hypothetical protein
MKSIKYTGYHASYKSVAMSKQYGHLYSDNFDIQLNFEIYNWFKFVVQTTGYNSLPNCCLFHKKHRGYLFT